MGEKSWGHTVRPISYWRTCSVAHCGEDAGYLAGHHSTREPPRPVEPVLRIRRWYCTEHAKKYAKKHGLELPAEGGCEE